MGVDDETQNSDTSKPFEETIEAIKDIPRIESPMRKLEYIYQLFITIMVREIDEFWQDVNISPSKLEIDYENLNGIAIYVVLKAALPLLLIDILFIENFVSNAIMATNRAFHMTVILNALTFIEETLPSYYDSKEKTNPLLDNMTPQFNTKNFVGSSKSQSNLSIK